MDDTEITQSVREPTFVIERSKGTCFLYIIPHGRVLSQLNNQIEIL